MKTKTIMFLLSLHFFIGKMNAQFLTGLKVDIKGNYDNTKTFFVSPLPDDKLRAVDLLKASLISKGLKLAGTMNEGDYLMTIFCKDRKDKTCGRTIAELTGEIMDIKNNSGAVGTFKFKQTSWETNCTSDIFNDLADRLKNFKSINNNASFSQSNLTMDDVYSAKEFVFYGFDFTNFRLIDEEYLGKGAEIKDKYFSAWSSYVINEMPMEKLQKLMKKERIIYNPVSITLLNSKVLSENVVQKAPYPMSKDVIKQSISKLDVPKESTSKIGMIINVDYFFKETKKTSAYVTFFEIQNGNIIHSEYILNKEATGYGLTMFWGKSLLFVIKDYFDKIYVKGMK